jgi:diadenosine tetraphosphatase ApaH/serine/threonine PP2A family protein phosphatase
VRYLVLSDLHANLQAFDAVLADAARHAYDEVLVLGDLVGYGADPGPVIDRTLELRPAALIRGNHDRVCAGLESSLAFNDIARQSIEWTAATLTPAQLHTLAELPKGPQLVRSGPEAPSARGEPESLEICHGAPFDEDYYVFDTNGAWRAMEAASARICLFGHTHLPGVFVAAPDEDLEVGSTDDALQLPARGRALINVGSVGQPRDGDPRAAYGILDTTRNTISLQRVAYDVAGAQARIRAEGLPEWLATRLERGQ